ncbi:Mbov_0400 family ICE element protein [Mycoplasma mycoides]|uniref:Uncharacterized protein n=1 Tax=Mycoplasma mycoides subsp. capri TaxID=40477 RepID=A0AB38GD75_MYCMC|nr:hypothetical protein [Mycoplasma mycoides]ADH21854.1 conserved hypothetical protein [synthetic Mycoplasma mycoides JCVI-syn1.0]ACU78310.1 conserved hypothetical protein [Mycoplasma mycoides subsp. capri str. GM12]ACU79140.1 conserved hypothetical protein [Mycoplasma mycoides subsp. capri str. GM12]SRX58338.1 hypothetical protein MMC68K_00086 [Mycoplasma mycoides subsp. capri]SRX60872.1 hypothetical protein MMC68C_00084 [Mycoplasma mycoides subsp. capri]
MNIFLIGKIYKFRNEDNKLPISRDYYGKLITTIHSKLHRPHIVLFSNTKVYYLSVKTIKDNKNLEKTFSDKKNLIIQEKNVYSKKLKHPKIGNAINCSTINVMDRVLFESLFEKDKPKNNYQIKPHLFDQILKILASNLRNGNLKYFEVDSFDLVNQKTLWKPEHVALENQKICSDFIIAYNKISEQEKTKLLHKPHIFFEWVKEKCLKII